ncbi:TPA: restriction endonuclease subunit S [Escherichia coli]|nr:restriction endonuclease subunit S [Escherichia coli]
MSELSYLEKLMDGVEVEWKAVGDIAGYSTTKVDADKLDATSFVGVDNLLADKGGRIDATYQPNTARLTAYEPGDILLGNIRPYLKKVWMAENNGGCSGDVLAIRILADCKKIISPEYLYYALSSDSFFSYSMQHAKGAKMPRGSKDAILNYQIPIPCPSAPEKSLAIQSEIVRILDKFTALTAELTAELNMRKKQYNYYRDQLLSFKEGEVEWKTLGEVAVIGTGNHDTQDAIEHGKYIFYARGREPLKLNVFDFDETAIITAGDGAGVGKVFHYAKGKYALHQRAYRIVPNAFMNPRFVYHYITAYFFTYIQKASVSSSVTSLRRPMFLKFPIPVPPSEEQARIVEILDKFDTLTNSITEGLPREIELRQKQYEYYRDLLFSFPKPETVSN